MEILLDLKLENYDKPVGLLKISKKKIEGDLLEKMENRNKEEILYSEIIENIEEDGIEELFLIEFLNKNHSEKKNNEIILKIPELISHTENKKPDKKFEIYKSNFFLLKKEIEKKDKNLKYELFNSKIFINKKKEENDNKKILEELQKKENSENSQKTEKKYTLTNSSIFQNPKKPEILKKPENKKKTKKSENRKYAKLKEEHEDLLDKIDYQKEIFQILLKNSLENLKIVGKVFSIKTEKKDFKITSIEKINKNIKKLKTQNLEDLEKYEKILKTHFWNIHEVYLNLLKKSEIKFSSIFQNLKKSCQNFSILSDFVVLEDCKNKQKLDYINDLMSKFSRLGKNEHLHYDVFSALLDVFDFKKIQKKLFMQNLKNLDVGNK